jgi:cytochrome c peroxidase
MSAGLDSLARVVVPQPSNLGDFVASKPMLIALGKALFWDMQVGSDGQACASCHFSGGADIRSKGQLNPGTLGGNTTFGSSGVAGSDGHANFGPDTQLSAADFPFHHGNVDTNNVVSSQGVFNAQFVPGVSGGPQDNGTAVVDPVFNVGGGVGGNVRRVAPRNAPTVINSVFNSQVFWDGKAQSAFNGVNPNGGLDGGAGVWVDQNGLSAPPVKTKVSLPKSSLASLAAAVPTNNTTMSFAGRTLTLAGRKLLGLSPLGQQFVHPGDGVLGSLSAATLGSDGKPAGGRGLKVSYSDLIKQAFWSKYWDSTQTVTLAGKPFTQMEANFPLFFGLSVQAYEATLVSDQTPFDKFMEGDNSALSAEQLQGLLIFVNTGQNSAAFSGVAQGNCVACHAGPEFTAAAFSTMDKTGPFSIRPMVSPGGGKLQVGPDTAYFDNGFANIGVRPTAEDPGRGGTITVAGQPKPVPMSLVRQVLAGLVANTKLPACGGSGQPVCPVGNRDGVQGALKIPGLRNVELTGPYLHNGGQATLKQAVAFYHNLDFADVNADNLDPRIADVHIGGGDETLLVSFLQSLTDGRVSNETGVFDHPQLFLPNGHPADQTLACVTNLTSCGGIELPALGSQGRPAAGLPPEATFLGLDPQAN